MEPIVDHMEITVGDMSTAVLFYDRFLPILGFDLRNRSAAFIELHDKHVVSYEHSRLGFAITSPRTARRGRARPPGADLSLPAPVSRTAPAGPAHRSGRSTRSFRN
jgi:catechol 2,3-dioxygenase-like lactoylglutathione lyase family enzyme